MKFRIRFFLFILMAVMNTTVFGQVSISGKVLSNEQKPIELAVCALFDLRDSSLIQTTLTDVEGVFVFEKTNADSVYFQFNCLGYATHSAGPFLVKKEGEKWQLPSSIILQSTVVAAKEIEVVAMRSFVQIKADRIVVLPDAMITAAGASAWDVLLKSPGVTANSNEDLMLRGKPGVNVYLEERPTYLSGSDLANFLRGMPASDVASIEVITNPGARYDAQGTGGVIVIRLKKNKTQGWSGTATVGYSQGIYHRERASVNLNYRINKVNFFTNLSYSLHNGLQDLTITRNYYDSAGTFVSGFNQHTFLRMGGRNYNGRVGFDYYVNDKITLGASYSGFLNDTFNRNNNESILSDENGEATGKVRAINPLDRIFINNSVNVNMNWKLDTLGKNLSVNGDYLVYDSESDQRLINEVFSSSNQFLSSTDLISNLPSKVSIYAVNADYANPINQVWSFDAGLKWSKVTTTNEAQFFDAIGAELNPNYDFTNAFDYKEQISAAYAKLSYTKDRWSAVVGLRGEATDISGYQLGNLVKPDSSFTRSYQNLFPTVYLMHNLDSAAKHVITFNAGRRIDRPNYQDMNPFTYPLDRFTLYSGNPFLLPAFSYASDLTYTYNNSISGGLLYTLTKDLMNETIRQDSSIFFSRPGNFGQQQNAGVYLYINQQWKEKWSFQLYTEVMNVQVKSTLNGREIDNKGNYFYIGPSITYSAPKDWTFELGGDYTTRVVTGQFLTIAVHTARAGVAKKFGKGKFTAKVSCDDLLRSMRPGGDILGLGDSAASWKSKFDSRVINFSLTYRFTKGDALKARTTNGVDTEKGRVK